MQFIEHPNFVPSNPGYRKLHPGYSLSTKSINSERRASFVSPSNGPLASYHLMNSGSPLNV